MNNNLHAICDSLGQPLNLFVTAGPVRDYIGARALRGTVPKADWLLGGRGHDIDRFKDASKGQEIRACIAGRNPRTTHLKTYKRRYKRCNRGKVILGRPKNRRSVATLYDQCPKVIHSAIALAGIVSYQFGSNPWLAYLAQICDG